jgi:hypothetical protein
VTATASVVYDATAPPEIQMLLNAGATATTDPLVTVLLYSGSMGPWSKQVEAVRIYGTGLDTTVDPDVAATSGAAAWKPFASTFPVVLSLGVGAKEVRVQLRDRFKNVGEVVGSINYSVEPAHPIVTMLRIPSGTLPALTVGPNFGSVEFDYRIDQACSQMDLTLVANSTDPYQIASVVSSFAAGYPAGKLFSAIGAVSSMCKVSAAALGASSLTGLAGTGSRIIKVFGKRASDGVWSL